MTHCTHTDQHIYLLKCLVMDAVGAPVIIF